jgi:hypothetical protein
VQPLKDRVRRFFPHGVLHATIPLRRWIAKKARRARTKSFVVLPPQSLNEKIRYRMLYDQNPLLTTFCDKWAVREYVKNQVGDSILPQVYALVSDPREFTIESLPDRCVIKPTHGSGAVIIVDDRASPEEVIPFPSALQKWTSTKVRVQKAQLYSESFTLLTRSWLRTVFAGDFAPAYRDVPPQLIVEEFIDAGDGNPPPDYKFICVDGQVVFFWVDLNRFDDHRRAIMLPDWTLLDARVVLPQASQIPRRPERFALALRVVEALARNIDFVRVDLLISDQDLRFGELTVYPEGGEGVKTPRRVFKRLASGWRPHLDYGPYLLRHL